MPPPARRWTEAEDDELWRLRAEGVTIDAIARELGRSHSSVRQRNTTRYRGVRGPLDRREDDSQPPVAPLTVPAAWAGAMRAILAADDLRAAAEAYRRPARLLAAMIRHADLVDVEGEDDAVGLLVPFLDRADRLERVARLG